MKTYPVTFVLCRGEGSALVEALGIFHHHFSIGDGAVDLGGCDYELTLSANWHGDDDPRCEDFVQLFFAACSELQGNEAARWRISDTGRST